MQGCSPHLHAVAFDHGVGQELHGLGFSDAANVRVGKTIELDVKGDDASAATAEATRMAEQLLANTVIESYRVEVG